MLLFRNQSTSLPNRIESISKKLLFCNNMSRNGKHIVSKWKVDLFKDSAVLKGLMENVLIVLKKQSKCKTRDNLKMNIANHNKNYQLQQFKDNRHLCSKIIPLHKNKDSLNGNSNIHHRLKINKKINSSKSASSSKSKFKESQ